MLNLVMLTIYNALGLNADTKKWKVIEKMLPYLSVKGAGTASFFLPSVGFTYSVTEAVAQRAGMIHLDMKLTGELDFMNEKHYPYA